MAPGRCSNYIGNSMFGNSATQPYIVAHHLILSHAAAVKLYREKYKAHQAGQIGVTLLTNWFVPISVTAISKRAARRAVDFMFGWFLHPMTYGDYPETMKALVGSRLPTFTADQSEMLLKSYDFLGVNYYTSNYAANAIPSNGMNLSMTMDNQANLTLVKDCFELACCHVSLNALSKRSTEENFHLHTIDRRKLPKDFKFAGFYSVDRQQRWWTCNYPWWTCDSFVRTMTKKMSD